MCWEGVECAAVVGRYAFLPLRLIGGNFSVSCHFEKSNFRICDASKTNCMRTYESESVETQSTLEREDQLNKLFQ